MERIRRLIARAQAMDPFRVDALVGVLLALGCVFTTRLDESDRVALTVLLLAGVGGATAFRRRAPIAAVAVQLSLLIAFERAAYVADWTLPALAIVLGIYSVAANCPGRRGWLGGTVSLALLMAAVALDPGYGGPDDFAFTLLLVWCPPFALGRALLNRRALTGALQAKAQRLERERERRAREAVMAERTRVARELHDVVAHSVSVMVIQAGAARRVAAGDREQAREALRSVRRTGREALAEMRRMVGALRRADDQLDGTPAPGLEHLRELAARARAAGLPVELRVEGARLPVGAGVDLAAYRVVQEALTNAIKHAGPARAQVVVRYGETALEVEVSDNGRGPHNAGRSADGSGHGLVGMRERIALYGGQLEVGRRRGGGFRVKARIPRERVAA